MMINELVNTNLIDEAYRWLCKQRKHLTVNSDVWDCRFHWKSIKPKLIRDLSTNFSTFTKDN
jgi:hypothetical protein